MKSVSSKEINKFSTLTNHHLSDLQFSNVSPPDRASQTSLVFTSTVDMVKIALKNGARGFIVLEKIFNEIQSLFSKEHCVWTTLKVNASMVEVLTLFDHKPQASKSIHPTAIIHPTAKVGPQVTIDEYAVIKENAVLKENCWIGPHAVIETSVEIGVHTHIGSHVVIASFCSIGDYCKISPHTVIGYGGFGFFTDKNHEHHRIPQIGKVVIEDRCEFGAHCAVDRATLTETRIKAGSKFDNFCHVGHNVTIGENALLTAGFMTSGSTIVGKNLTTGGGTHLSGHLRIADNVTLVARAGVLSSIDEPGIYGGFPHLPHKESLRVLTSLGFLPKMRKQLSAILKHLKLEE